jgi:replicative DNA helicase
MTSMPSNARNFDRRGKSAPDVRALDVAGRAYPADPAAEELCVAAAIGDARALAVLVQAGLAPTDLHSPSLANVYAMLVEIEGASGNFPRLVDELRRRSMLTDLAHEGREGIRLLSHLSTLGDAGYQPASLAEYARQLRARARLRRFLRAGQTLVGEGFDDPADVDAFIARNLDSVEQAAGVAESADTMVSAADFVEARYEQLKAQWRGEREYGLPLRQPYMTRRLMGLEIGGVSIVGAKTGVGKTIFAEDVALHVAGVSFQGQPAGVLYATLELPRATIMDRALCHEARVEMRELATGKEWANNGANAWWPTGELSHDKVTAIDDARRRIASRHLLIEDSARDVPSLQLAVRRARAKFAAAGVKLRLVVIDHLHLVQFPDAGGATYAKQIADACSAFKAMAVGLELHAMVLAQFTNAASRDDRLPEIHDIKEGSAIQQIADMILLLHKPKDTDSGLLIAGKTRTLGQPKIPVRFFQQHFRIEDEVEERKARAPRRDHHDSSSDDNDD